MILDSPPYFMCLNFIGKPLKKAVNGFRLKKYYALDDKVPQLLEDSVFQLGSSDSSYTQSDISLCKFHFL